MSRGIGLAPALLAAGLTVAQAAVVDTLWLRDFRGDSARLYNRAAELYVDTVHGAVYVCGSLEQSRPDWLGSDMGLACYSTDGTLRWHVQLGGNTWSEYDMAHALAIDSTGSIYIAGITGNLPPRYDDYTAAKYTPSGERAWYLKSCDSLPLGGNDGFFDIAVGRGGQVYACGARYNSPEYQSEYLVVRLNPGTGETLWTRGYILDTTAAGARPRRDLHPDFPNYDWTDWDNCATAVAIDPRDGGIVTTGFGFDDRGETYYEWWTMKHDSTGRQLWQRTDHGPAPIPDDDDAAFDLVVDRDGNCYACGFMFAGDDQYYDYAVTKTSPGGELLYRRTYGDPVQLDDDCAFDLCLDDATPPNLYVTGYIGFASGWWDIVTHKFRTATMDPVWGVGGTGARWGLSGDDIGYRVSWQGGRVYVAGVRGGQSGSSDDIILLCYSDADAGGARKDTLWTWAWNSADNREDYAGGLHVTSRDGIYLAGQAEHRLTAPPVTWTSQITARLRVEWRDVAAVAMSAPPDSVMTGDSVRPAVVVRNLGNVLAGFTTWFTIGEAYIDSVRHAALAPGDSAVDTFRVWVPDTAGTFTARCTVGLAADSVPGNNRLSRSVRVHALSGAGAVESPPMGWRFSVEPSPAAEGPRLVYATPRPALLSVRLYDAAGRVARVAAESRPVAGSGALDLDTRGLAPGVYLVRVDAGVGVPVTSLKLLLQ